MVRTSCRTQAPARDVDKQVRKQLSGAMVGYLPAAIDLEHRDAVLAQQVLAPTGKPERIDRLVLGEPDFVARRGAARGIERLHRAPRGLILGQPEIPDQASRADLGRGVHLQHHHDLRMGGQFTVKRVELFA
jgi:hypothetical protein